MQNPVTIENIEDMRRREGIDDVDLRRHIRTLAVGDLVRLTLSSNPKTFETLTVRITSIHNGTFRGKLACKPLSNSLAQLPSTTLLSFAASHIHSVAPARPN